MFAGKSIWHLVFNRPDRVTPSCEGNRQSEHVQKHWLRAHGERIEKCSKVMTIFVVTITFWLIGRSGVTWFQQLAGVTIHAGVMIVFTVCLQLYLEKGWTFLRIDNEQQ